MSDITTIEGSDQVNESREVINENFENLNTDKLEKHSGATTGNLAKFGAGNELEDSGKTVSDFALAAALAAHIADTNNPHAVDATDVGLGSVQNYGIASQAEAEAGSATNKYMTPQRVAQAIAALASGAGLVLRTTISTVFGTAARFVANHTSGTGTFNDTGLVLDTTTTANRIANILFPLGGSSNNVHAGSPVIRAVFRLTSIGTAGFGYIGTGEVNVAANITNSHFGFKITIAAGVGTLVGSQANGSAESVTAALTTIAANDVVEVCARLNGSSSVDYYWRKNGGSWSAATNLATNLPGSHSDYIGSFAANNAATATQNILRVASYSYER